MHKTETGSSGRGLSVSIQCVSRSYGHFKAVDDVTLDVRAGEFLSLVGPSGSGKTTLLMMLAGFEEPSSGRLIVGGRDITGVPPNQRNIGMVFQKYALFPHKTVADNICFPLRMRGIGKAERERKVRSALEMVKLSGLGARMPAQLSGGQQQRVALARAIVFEPPVILMDEPLGALDKKLRQHMQVEIKELQARLRCTVIYVTHDQEEALTMSDRVAVLNHGRLVQLGAPRELYDRPANSFVAEFLGDMNFVPGQVVGLQGDAYRVRAGDAAIEACSPHLDRIADGAAVRVAVRPEHVRVAARDGEAEDGRGLSGCVSRLVFNGATFAILIRLDQGATIRADIGTQSDLANLRAGDRVIVTWSAANAHLYPEAA